MTAQILGYRTHILWMYTHEHLLICQEFVNLTNPSPTRHISFRSPSTSTTAPIQQYSSRILLSSSPQILLQPSNPIRPLTTTTPSRLHRSSISHLVQLFLLDLPCTFYRSDLLFILSESTLPEQQRLHDNLSLIQPAAVCSFR